MSMILVCERCGRSFPRGARGPAGRYCGATCRAHAARERDPERYAKYEATTARRRKARKPDVACRICGELVPKASARRVLCGNEACDRARAVERVMPHVSARRAKQRGAEIEIFKAVEIFARDGWVCQLCGEPTDRDVRFPSRRSPSVDHVVPLSRGGAHTRANTQCAHLACNMSKGAQVAA